MTPTSQGLKQPQASSKPEDDDEGAYTGDPRKEQQRWARELTAAEKEMRKFIDSGRGVVKAYLDQRSGQLDVDADSKMNLFWSNIQVLKSSLYAKPPKVDVKRTFKDENDDVARVAGTILERILNSGIETDGSDFDVTTRHCIEDYLLPGMGQMWLRYEVETTRMKTEPVMDPVEPTRELVPSVEFEQITSEDVLSDYVYWQDFRYSPCRTWEDARWAARRTFLSRTQAVKRFGEKAKLLPTAKAPRKSTPDSISPQNDPWNKIEIWEIWCKEERTVYWYCPGHDVIVDVKRDPLRLEGFLPCPKPLVTNTTTSNFLARSDYVLAQDQYTQIDELTTRIKYLTRACKAVGVYDKQATALGRVFQEGMENQMIPVDAWAAFAEKGGLKGAMELLDVSTIAEIIERLTAQRETLKSALYEVLGLSDIMRGATDPSETLGAQEIKAQFGSARLTAKQAEIGEWAAEALRIKAQIVIRHWQPQTIIERSNIAQSVDAPFAQQAVALLKSDKGLRYRITIDPDSMSTLDWAAERDARTQAITAIGTFVTAVTPLVQDNAEAMPVALQMLKWMMGGFKVGKEIETVLDQAIAAASQPKQPDTAEIQKSTAETKKLEAETDAKMADALKTLGEAAQLGLMEQVNQVLVETGLPPLSAPTVTAAMALANPEQVPGMAGAGPGGPPGAPPGPGGSPQGAPPPEAAQNLPPGPGNPQQPVPAIPATQMPQGMPP